MQIVSMIYVMLLLVAFFIPIILSIICYLKDKNDIYLALILLFSIISIDHLVICLTEFIPWFAEKYDQMFMGAPTWKTLAYLLAFGCLIFIGKKTVPDSTFTIPGILLILMGVFQLFVPMMETSAKQVWLYYLPAQVYLFAFSIYVLRRVCKMPERKTDPIIRFVFIGSIVTLICPIFIAIEDYIVIFHQDVYEQGKIIINNRNLSEDIEHIIMVIISSIYLSRSLISTDKKEIVEKEPKNVLQTEEKSVISIDTPLEEEVDLTKEFFNKYQLTEREQSIFKLLMEDMSNQEISEKLMISLGTTKTHTHNIFGKLDVTKRKEAKELYKAYIQK